ncbi:MAG: hypothetical protein PHS19_04670 [Eubacteriales bacterium]|nr:hypothetical protein [Eubacteriales bacterium]
MTLKENLQRIKNNNSLTVSVPEAAEIMGVTPQLLRAALLQDKFPFGVGVKMVQNEFYINTFRFVLYMEGADLRLNKDND